MANVKSLRSWDAMWNKLQSLLGFSGVESPFGRDTNPVIDEPLTLYVETTGNDNNPGTKRAPFLTIQAALDSLKGREIAAAVTVRVGAGEFDGFEVGGLQFYKSGSLRILGSVTILEGSTAATSSANEGNGFLIITNSGKAWDLNQWKGKYVRYSSTSYPISSNTATTLKIMTTASSLAVPYEIIEPSTIVKDVVSPTVGGTTILFASNVGQSLASQVTLEMVSSQTASTGSVRFRPGSHATCLNVSNNRGFLSAGGTIDVTRCVVKLGAFGFSTAANLAPVNANVMGCYFETSAGWCIYHENGLVRIGTCVFDAVGGGVSMHIAGPNAIISAATNNPPIEINGSSDGIRLQQGARACVTGQTTVAVGLNLRGTGNTTAIIVNTGAKLALSSVANVTGSTEISVDGVTSTLAAMRASSPKVFPATPNAYGSCVYE